MESVNAFPKLLQVLPAGPALEAQLPSLVGVEFARTSVEFEFDERHKWQRHQDKVDAVAFNELLNFGFGLGKKATEVVAENRFVPSAQGHDISLQWEELDGLAESSTN